MTAVDPQRTRRWQMPARVVWWHRLVFLAALVGLWELTVSVGLFNERFISPPSAVFVALPELLGDAGVRNGFSQTGAATAVAFGLSIVVGVTLGALIGTSEFVCRTVRPLLMLLFAIPKMVLVPVFVLIFGLGIGTAGVFAFSLGVFPVLLNTIEGAQSVDARLRVTAHSLGAGRWHRVRYLIAPSVLPSVLTGVRLGLVQSMLGTLMAELYGTTRGVGYYATGFAQTFQPDKVFGLLLLVALSAVSLNTALGRLEHRLARWRVEN
ncbi:MAG TPA: ABC transporter permease [Ilumatobacter sp.]|nr:ABC transporter permease [Ilumatobacter sp.]